jgi:hypothetical protein
VISDSSLRIFAILKSSENSSSRHFTPGSTQDSSKSLPIESIQFSIFLFVLQNTLNSATPTSQTWTTRFNFESSSQQLKPTMKSGRPRHSPKNKFSAAEDARLRGVISCGHCLDWTEVAKQMPGRNSRQCRERWNNYVNPSISYTPWTEAEDELLETKVAELGASWKIMTGSFPNRSKNQIRNHWFARARQMERKYSQPMQNSPEFDSFFDMLEQEDLCLDNQCEQWPSVHEVRGKAN